MLSTSSLQALAMSPGIIDLVQDPSMGGGEDSGHELVFMMHLLEQLNGSNALLDFLNSPITAYLPFLIPYKRKLTVSCGHVCVCVLACECLSVSLFVSVWYEHSDSSILQVHSVQARCLNY